MKSNLPSTAWDAYTRLKLLALSKLNFSGFSKLFFPTGALDFSTNTYIIFKSNISMAFHIASI